MNMWKDVTRPTIREKKKPQTKPSIHSIALFWCRIKGLSIAKVRSDDKSHNLVRARYHITSIATEADHNISEIADYLNKSYHSIRHYLEDYTPPK